MNRNAFITWGGWSGHEPEQTSALFAKLLAEKGFAVERVDSLSPLADTEKMKTFDLIVPVWTMSSIAKEELRGLLEAVRSGVGIGGWHGGMGDAFRQETEYQWMVGGQWVAHPGNAIDYTVEVVKNDPITAGIGTFAMLPSSITCTPTRAMRCSPSRASTAGTPTGLPGRSCRRHGSGTTEKAGCSTARSDTLRRISMSPKRAN